MSVSCCNIESLLFNYPYESLGTRSFISNPNYSITKDIGTFNIFPRLEIPLHANKKFLTHLAKEVGRNSSARIVIVDL